jgi:alanine racemase
MNRCYTARMPSDPTWAEVDLSAFQNNLRRMKAIANTQLMAVVKANAYGHGAEVAARAAALAGADWLGVARASEGMLLRENGLSLPILVMGYTPPPQGADAIGSGLSLAAYDVETVQAYAALAGALGKTAHLHLKVETGMGRLGVLPDEALDVVRAMSRLDRVVVEGIFTHFARADETDHGSAHAQLAKFESVLRALTGVGLRPPLIHAANSAAALTLPEARYDLVRAGIALYGLHPSDAVRCPDGFAPALTWKASVAQVKTLPPGHGISYGSEYVTSTYERVAVVTAGYADGFRRILGNAVLLHGQPAPVRGRVCMDQFVIGISHIPDVRPGDEVVLVGRQGEAALSAEEVARRWGTINYEVVCGVAARVPRIYR